MLSDHLRILYLHGFASSPASRKARYFSEKLQDRGIAGEIPDLAEGEFERLTVTRKLKVIENSARHEPVILIGSSLGGYLAALYAASHRKYESSSSLRPLSTFSSSGSVSLG